LRRRQLLGCLVDAKEPEQVDAVTAPMNLEFPASIAYPLPNISSPTTFGRRADVLCVIGSGFGTRRHGLVGEGSG
jgi:hypothetical protein